jgi:hypothetical protein
MGIRQRLKRLEHQVRTLSGRDGQDIRLRQSQQYQYQKLCEMLDCPSEDLPYVQYLPVWWETTHVTWWLAQAAPDAAMGWLAQHHCPMILPALERFLQRPRFVDPFWALQHEITPGWHSAYWHFVEVLTRACHTLWPQIAATWLTLGYDAQSWLLQCWLYVSDPETCQWGEETSEEQKQTALKAILTRLYAEYEEVVLHACSHWHPGMSYAYKDNPAYGLQPSGWGLEGQPLGGGKHTPPLDDTAAAWQRHCAHQLQARWVAQAAEAAVIVDQTTLLARGQAMARDPFCIRSPNMFRSAIANCRTGDAELPRSCAHPPPSSINRLINSTKTK